MSGPDAEALYELPEEMRVVAGMLSMGERIQFGRNADLLQRGAAEIERLRAEIESRTQRVADAMARECRKAVEAGDTKRAEMFAAAQRCIATVYTNVQL
jgi:hypothetical protein